MRQQSAYINRTTALFSAAAKFCHDVYCAPYEQNQWKKITETELIWSHANHDIGWRCHNKKLTRTEGNYDISTERWQKSSKSLAATNIQVIFTMVREGSQIRALEVTYAESKPVTSPVGHAAVRQGHILKQYVALRNRGRI